MYGGYDLIGEIDSQSGKIVYRAHRRKRDYTLKVCCTSSGPEHPPSTEFSLETKEEDPRRQFLNSVKLQKEVIKTGSRRFAPIHQEGVTPDGSAWYASDYYPRGSLKRWVNSQMEVDDADLRWVIKSVLKGLLDLKKATGRSHGNLKLTNILMGGEIGTPLQETPLFLTDPSADLKTWSGSLELQDLKSLGEIILQLVTKRESNGQGELVIPPETAHEWNQLGERRNHWIKLCQRLLDPELSLQTVSLQRLASELGITSRRPQMSKILLLCLLLIATGGTGYWLYYRTSNSKVEIPSMASPLQGSEQVQVRASLNPEQVEREYQHFVELAEEMEQAGKYGEALKHYTTALQWKTNDLKCRNKISELRPKARAQQQTSEMLNVALIIARAAEQAGSFTNALERYEWALYFDANNPEAKEKIRELQPKAQAQRLATTNLAQAIIEAQAAEAAGDFIVASALYQAVQQLSPDDSLASQKILDLAPKAEKQRKDIGKLMAAWQETTNLISRADQLIAQKKFTEAANELDRAIAENQITLQIDPSPDLKELHSALLRKAQGVREFDHQVKLGMKAFQEQSYRKAQQHFSHALELIPDEEKAVQMMEEISKHLEKD